MNSTLQQQQQQNNNNNDNDSTKEVENSQTTSASNSIIKETVEIIPETDGKKISLANDNGENNDKLKKSEKFYTNIEKWKKCEEFYYFFKFRDIKGISRTGRNVLYELSLIPIAAKKLNSTVNKLRKKGKKKEQLEPSFRMIKNQM